MVKIESFELGGRAGGSADIPVMGDGLLSSDVNGLLGPSFFASYDVEVDFERGKLNLFLPDHCPGQVVYWTRSAYARVPMSLDRGFHIQIPVLLDGQSVTATVDTGAAESTMTVEEARDLFGWPKENANLKSLPNGVFRYPFASMTFEGVTVQNPQINLFPRSAVVRAAPEMLLGNSILRQLHLYIAYKEKALYLTPAEAR